MRSVGIVLVAAMAIAAHAPAFAGGPADNAGADNLLGALAGSQLSTKALSTARGQGGVIIDGANTLVDSMNTTNNVLNVNSSSGGSLEGSVTGSSLTGALAGSTIENSDGFINQFANTGNNVMINSSMSVFVNAQ
jgi:hypothetical protein